MLRSVLDRCDALLREERNESLLDVMFGRPGAAGDLDDPRWKQPAIYALECALSALWASIGIRPDVVFGHSLGEIAAAHVAGVFSLEDGLRFAAARGALIGALPGEGAMAAVFAPAPQVAAALDEHNAASAGVGLCIAADNGAQQVISGPAAEVAAMQERLEAQDIRVARLRRSPAYHSAMVEPALDDLGAVLSTISFSPPAITFVSNLTGHVRSGRTRRSTPHTGCARPANRWHSAPAWRRLRRSASMPSLKSARMACSVRWPPFAGRQRRRPVSPAFAAPGRTSRKRSPGTHFRKRSPALTRQGFRSLSKACSPARNAAEIPLPSYPFQRERHWIEPSRRQRREGGHPLLGVRRESPRGEVTFETEIFAADPDWVKDHLVFGQVVVPGAMFATMAATVLWGERAGSVVLDECQLHSPMIVPRDDAREEAGAGEGGRKLQIVFDGSDGNSPRRFEVFSRGGEDGWTLHLDGRMSRGGRRPEAVQPVDIERLTMDLEPGDVASLYRNKVSTRVVLGPAFRPLQAVWSGEGEAVGEVMLPDVLDGGGLDLHPILLDGCFQTVLAARDQARVAGTSTYMPFGWDRLWLAGPPPEKIFCHVRMRETVRRGGSERDADDSPEVVKADLKIYAPTGEPVGGVDGFTMKRATRSAMLSASTAVKDLLYEIVWRQRPLAVATGWRDTSSTLEAIRNQAGSFPDYLEAEGVRPEERAALLEDLDRLGCAYTLRALKGLGWQTAGGRGGRAGGAVR